MSSICISSLNRSSLAITRDKQTSAIEPFTHWERQQDRFQAVLILTWPFYLVQETRRTYSGHWKIPSRTLPFGISLHNLYRLLSAPPSYTLELTSPRAKMRSLWKSIAPPFRTELKLLIINKLSSIKVTPTKEALTQGIEKPLAKGFDLAFQAAKTGTKRAFFSFLKMAQIDMSHNGTLGFIPIKSFDRQYQSNASMNILVEKVGTRLVYSQPIVGKGLGNNKVEDKTKNYNDRIVGQLHLETELSSKASNEDSVTQGGRARHRMWKIKKVIFCQREHYLKSTRK